MRRGVALCTREPAPHSPDRLAVTKLPGPSRDEHHLPVKPAKAAPDGFVTRAHADSGGLG
ncbi:hypothetical protein GCM10010357_33360 [Streptomyces luteireticuli]|uniref:Uncharacterized protein n=1 Tax=Streptomyces luteireticuli TaxID=173858 RepID=A0ABN0YTJ0_9ACTN